MIPEALVPVSEKQLEDLFTGITSSFSSTLLF